MVRSSARFFFCASAKRQRGKPTQTSPNGKGPMTAGPASQNAPRACKRGLPHRRAPDKHHKVKSHGAPNPPPVRAEDGDEVGYIFWYSRRLRGKWRRHENIKAYRTYFVCPVCFTVLFCRRQIQQAPPVPATTLAGSSPTRLSQRVFEPMAKHWRQNQTGTSRHWYWCFQ